MSWSQSHTSNVSVSYLKLGMSITKVSVLVSHFYFWSRQSLNFHSYFIKINTFKKSKQYFIIFSYAIQPPPSFALCYVMFSVLDLAAYWQDLKCHCNVRKMCGWINLQPSRAINGSFWLNFILLVKLTAHVVILSNSSPKTGS